MEAEDQMMKARTPEYSAWRDMLKRCYNEASENYKFYGARGITVCTPWRESFLAFLDWIGPRPSRAYSLDRFPDGNGNYEPGNVRWATAGEQARNRRSTRFITFDNRTQAATDWAIEKGIGRRALYHRLNAGWSIEKALTTPVAKRGAK